MSRPVLWFIHLPILWVPGRQWRGNEANYLDVVPKLKMRGIIPPLPIQFHQRYIAKAQGYNTTFTSYQTKDSHVVCSCNMCFKILKMQMTCVRSSDSLFAVFSAGETSPWSLDYIWCLHLSCMGFNTIVRPPRA